MKAVLIQVEANYKSAFIEAKYCLCNTPSVLELNIS